MASRMMHLAVGERLAADMSPTDRNRFLFGCLLPDACPKFTQAHISHFKKKIKFGTKVTYDLTAFRSLYGEKLCSDPLYTGYYMHLVQDLVFRRFVYETHAWDPTPDGNIRRLHNDYRLLNTYLVGKYALQYNLTKPADIEKEDLYGIYPFDCDTLLASLQEDFVPYTTGEAFFFTAEMADVFLAEATAFCRQVIRDLQNGIPSPDEKKYAWQTR